MVGYNFIKNFLGKKVMINVALGNGTGERYYTADILEVDPDSESILIKDKFGMLITVSASSVTKIEQFDENHIKGTDKEESR